MKMRFFRRFCVAWGCFGAICVSLGQSNTLSMDVARQTGDLDVRVGAAARSFAKTLTKLTQNAWHARQKAGLVAPGIPFTMPMRMEMVRAGRPLVNSRPNPQVADLTLSFDSTGAGAFTSDYRALLQTVFDTAKSTMTAVFGAPSSGGVVHVVNYDASIGDRDAVAGGVYLPDNGTGTPEIRFPVYNSSETAAVNFVHCLLLAYLGADAYGYDAFEEGLTRAAVMKIVRTPGAMPANLDADQLNNVLLATYDTSSFYDWYNQRALGCSQFIAPNLKSGQLPVGGSTGGLYLLRYLMAGTAWSKVLVEYPTFAAAFNTAFYGDPSIASNVDALVALAQQAMDSIQGQGSTIEGMSFGDWYARQFSLDTTNTQGVKLLMDPLPITSGLASPDFGVYIIQATAFTTDASRNESLLSGTSYPVFWDDQWLRIVPSAQDETMSFAGGYASVAPNFPDEYSGAAYALAADLPFQDQLSRVYLPVGCVATPTSNVSDCFGTVTGVTLASGDSLNVYVITSAGTLGPIPVSRGAFGAYLNNATFSAAGQVVARVVLTHNGTDAEIIRRTVDKNPGALALDLRYQGEAVQSLPLAKGLQAIGLGSDPLTSDWPGLLNIAAPSAQIARYSPTKSGYALYPSLEAPRAGHGYFVRLDAAQPSFSLTGRSGAATPVSVAMQPGWNMISVPTTSTVPFANTMVVKGTDFPISLAEAEGVSIGIDVFGFQPGANDPYTGAPETGSFTSAAAFVPGQAYFLRVLAPEGVTLLFRPSTQAQVAHAAASVGGVRAQAQVAGWKAQLSLTDGTRTVAAYVGTSPTATAGFDAREDSTLPPAVSDGMQVTSQGGTRLFRDIRSSASPTLQFFLSVEGLTAGKTYRVSFAPVSGTLRHYQLYDPDTGGGWRTQPLSYTFVAKSTSKSLRIDATGSGR